MYVKAHIGYASVVWTSYINCQITTLEKIHIQCRAAHFVCNNYSRFDSVTEMSIILNWPSL